MGRAYRRRLQLRRSDRSCPRLPRRGLADFLEREQELRIIDLEIEQGAEIGVLNTLGCEGIVVEQITEQLGRVVEGTPGDPLADRDDVAIAQREQATGILVHPLLEHVDDELPVLVVAVQALEARK